MKQKDWQKLKSKSREELLQELSKMELDLRQKRLELSAGKLSNVASYKLLSKDVARVKTLVRELEMGQGAEARLSAEQVSGQEKTSRQGSKTKDKSQKTVKESKSKNKKSEEKK